jgi:hypothetical protein
VSPTALPLGYLRLGVGGYAFVLIAPAILGVLVYMLLLLYYRCAAGSHESDIQNIPSHFLAATAMSDFFSVARDYFGYHRRGLILVPSLLVLPVGYLAAQSIVPSVAGTSAFAPMYSTLLQTTAEIIAALLVVIAVQIRLAARETRFAIREAGLVAVLWTVFGEVAALVALSPELAPRLQAPAFRMMIAGGASGLVTLLMIAIQSASERARRPDGGS